MTDSVNFLNPAGNAILVGCFGLSVVRALRRSESIEACFVGLGIGMAGLVFAPAFFASLQKLSELLSQDIQKLGDAQGIKALVWESIRRASAEPDGSGNVTSGPNIPAVMEQVFRLGVWGVLSSIGDFLFLIAQAFVEVRRDVLMYLVQFLFPLLWGAYPALPKLGHTLLAYVIEMSLWGPCLYLIQIALGAVAPKYVNRSGSLGVPLVAMEIVAALMILSVPKTVHGLLSGALHPGGESEVLGAVIVGSRSSVRAFKNAQAMKKAGEVAT
jgi:hypothetical protein